MDGCLAEGTVRGVETGSAVTGIGVKQNFLSSSHEELSISPETLTSKKFVRSRYPADTSMRC